MTDAASPDNLPERPVMMEWPMEYTSRYEVKKWNFRFDFDIGYLVKSPCRDCESKGNLPRCSNTCRMLDRIQAILSESICCTRRR